MQGIFVRFGSASGTAERSTVTKHYVGKRADVVAAVRRYATKSRRDVVACWRNGARTVYFYTEEARPVFDYRLEHAISGRTRSFEAHDWADVERQLMALGLDPDMWEIAHITPN